MPKVRTGRDLTGDTIRSPRLQGATNAYAGEIPAYSLVKPTAVTGDLLTVTRPDADSLTNVVATGPSKIAQSTAGLCSGNWPLPVVYAGAAPAVGDERGTASGSFQLTTGKTGFVVVAVDAGNGLAWIQPKGGGGGSIADAFTAVDGDAILLTADDAFHVLDLTSYGVSSGAVAVSVAMDISNLGNVKRKGDTYDGALIYRAGAAVVGCDAGGIEYKVDTGSGYLRVLGYWSH